jgi:hypothetical protein
MTFPNMFSTLVAQGGNPAAGGYPYQIRAEDLDKNFVFSALDADPSLVDQVTGSNGHQGRKLKIPAVPTLGTYVLGSVDGVLEWISTEECA